MDFKHVPKNDPNHNHENQDKKINRKKIVIAGGTGYIGRAIVEELLKHGYEPHLLTRSKSLSDPKISYSNWNINSLGPWTKALEGAYAVINLSGQSLMCRWTEENKEKIINSRIDSTVTLGRAISLAKNPPIAWINVTGIGIYADFRPNKPLRSNSGSESSTKGRGFIADLALQTEKVFYEAKTPGTYKVSLRIGVVIGKGSPALNTLYNLTKKFLGGTIGSGKQYFSWIYIKDLARMTRWLLENDICGPVNATSPNPIPQKELMLTLRKLIHLPWGLPVPTFVVRIYAKIMGIDPKFFLGSYKILPTKALENGFNFECPTIEEAITKSLSEN